MNSKDARRVVQENLKKDIIAQYNHVQEEVESAIDNNTDTFIGMLNIIVQKIVTEGELTYSDNTYCGRDGLIQLADIQMRPYVWKEFLKTKTNPKINDWANKNQIYLTTILSNVDFNRIEFKLVIDLNKHSFFYRIFRRCLGASPYYKFLALSIHSEKELLISKGKKLGLRNLE